MSRDRPGVLLANKRSNPFRLGNRQFVFHISRVSGRRWFDQQQLDFTVRYGPMFDRSGNDQHITRPQRNRSVAKLDRELPVDDKKQLVFVFVPMPDKFASQPCQFDVLVVNGSNNLGVPNCIKGGEFFVEIDFLHDVTDPLPRQVASNSIRFQAFNERFKQLCILVDGRFATVKLDVIVSVVFRFDNGAEHAIVISHGWR